MNKYSRLFKMVRMELRFTQKDLADQLQINVGSVYKYENEKMMPGARVLEKMYKLCKSKNLSEPLGLLDQQYNIHQRKGDSDMDYRYLSDLQKEKIQHQEDEINRLTKIVENYTTDKPAFHFKTKAKYNQKTNTFGKSEVTGDVSMTGYTKEYLSNLKADEWFSMYHPESANVLVKSVPNKLPDYTHNMFNNILWKSKVGKYRVYNIETYFDKNEGIVRSYYYWVNGDIEAKS